MESKQNKYVMNELIPYGGITTKTAKNKDQLRNPTFSNRVLAERWKCSIFFCVCQWDGRID